MAERIVVASDHGGLSLKNEIKEHLAGLGFEVVDFGTDSTESVDYAHYAYKVAKAISEDEFSRGLLFCGTGIGMSLAANKVKGIRCAVCSDVFSAKYTKKHNNANILALGGRVLAGGLAIEIVNAWLNAKFEAGRHQRRINLITNIENNINI